MLDVLLEDLERRLEPRVEDALHLEWKRFVDGEWRGDIFSPARTRAAPYEELVGGAIHFCGKGDHYIALIGLPRPAAEEALQRRRNLRNRVHCW